ncbi:MAG: hypothetical protein ACPL7A_01470 [Anaerolineales bacterium]
MLLLILIFILAATACNFVPQINEVTFSQRQMTLTPTLFEPSVTRIIHPSPTGIPPSSTPEAILTPTETDSCAGLILRIKPPIEFQKDLFEHHAKGTFLILNLEILNLSGNTVQIYSEDYHLSYALEGANYAVIPHPAATNYLYIRRGGSFYQDKIQPNINWSTYLAFDVPPQGENWLLKITINLNPQNHVCQYDLYPPNNQAN